MTNRIAESPNGEGTHQVAPPWTGRKWEYQQVLCPPDNQAVGNCCAQAGEQGWELTGMMAVNVPQAPGLDPVTGELRVSTAPAVMLMFKRPVG